MFIVWFSCVVIAALNRRITTGRVLIFGAKLLSFGKVRKKVIVGDRYIGIKKKNKPLVMSDLQRKYKKNAIFFR
jgi:hypothetical protein